MANFKITSRAGELFTARVVGTEVSKGDALRFTNGGVMLAEDGDRVDCFATETKASGEYVTCARGQMRLVGRAATGVNFAVGADVYLNATQELDAGTTGDVAIGKVVGEDPESGGLVEVEFDPFGATVHA